MLLISLKALLGVSSTSSLELITDILLACPFAGEPFPKNRGLSCLLLVLLGIFAFLAALALFFFRCFALQKLGWWTEVYRVGTCLVYC